MLVLSWHLRHGLRGPNEHLWRGRLRGRPGSKKNTALPYGESGYSDNLAARSILNSLRTPCLLSSNLIDVSCWHTGRRICQNLSRVGLVTGMVRSVTSFVAYHSEDGSPSPCLNDPVPRLGFGNSEK